MITPDNIEIYLVDYADGSLSPAQEAELKTFLQLHPEWTESLEDWEQVKLTPPVVRYPHKAQLKQMAAEGSIPADEPRLIPDSDIRFEKKAALYRKNTAVLFWRRLSVAAILLLFLCAGSVYLYLRQPATLPVADNICIQKEQPLLPQQHILSAFHADAPHLPEKLALKRTIPVTKIQKKQTIAWQQPVEILAVSAPADAMMPEKFPSVDVPRSPEIILTEQARTWKSSEENSQSRNIITSFIDAGKSLVDKIRKEEYASR